MSTQKGNTSRSRSQKHKNTRAFKNNLHDTSHATKMINNIVVSGVCQRCKEIIEWKIKYKKYKPLTQPRKCVRCEQKVVKQAYHIMCVPCGEKYKVCTKCSEAKEIITKQTSKEEGIKLDNDMEAIIKTLPERKRRTFMRYLDRMNKQKDNKEIDNKDVQKELWTKLEELRVSNNDGDEFDCSSSDNIDCSDSDT